jgi:hypothetical protein
MARVIYSAMVDEIRGSVGGTTFQANQYGFTIKRKQRNQIPPSASQFTRKSSFQNLAGQWSALTGTQRTAWNTFASTYPQASRKDATINLSGYALFQRINLIRSLDNSLPLIDDVPNGPGTFTTPTIAVTLVAGVLTFTLSLASISGNHRQFAFASAPLPPGVLTPTNLLRYLAQGTLSSSPGTIDITSSYTSVFGKLPAVGDLLAVKVIAYRQNSGQAHFPALEIITVTT